MPKLIIVQGPFGAGKTTIISRFLEQTAIEYVAPSFDKVKKWYSQYTSATHRQRVYALVHHIACTLVEQGEDIILEFAIYASPEKLSQLIENAKSEGFDIHHVIIEAPYEVILERMHERRMLERNPERVARMTDEGFLEKYLQYRNEVRRDDVTVTYDTSIQSVDEIVTDLCRRMI